VSLCFFLILVPLRADIFRYDPEYEENEKQYLEIRRDILGEDDEEEEEKVCPLVALHSSLRMLNPGLARLRGAEGGGGRPGGC
jgi:hypothetical protein